MSKTKPKSKTKSVQRWEYMKVTESYDVDFDGLGRNGWELVAVVNSGNDISFLKYWFKRPLR